MGLLDRLRDLVFEENEQAEPALAVTHVATPDPSASGTAAGAAAAPEVVSSDGAHKLFADSLKQAIDRSNLPGFDFYELHQIFAAQVRAGSSAETAIQKALDSAGVMRVSKDELLRHHDHYAAILNEERKKFAGALLRFRDENLKDAQARQSALGAVIEDKKRLLEQMRAELGAAEREKQDIDARVAEKNAQMEDLKHGFARAFADIAGELAVLSTYLRRP
ncbi:MAG: hypothetical protein HYV63_22695 [Candidatus Schekmanbacteria bacterium]|nr:hypothetical protein [Candidatus Schekmanbacteria bacterium]